MNKAGFWIALSALMVASCGPPPAATNETEPDRALVEQVLRQPLPYEPGPDEGGTALRDEILADFRVTFDEYQRAATAAVDCMRRRGFEVEGPSRYPEGAYVLIVPGVDPTQVLTWAAINTSDEDRWLEVSGACYAQWLFHVETVWELQSEPTEQEVQQWLERAWACAEAKGMDLSDPPTEQEAVDSVSLGCRPWESDG